MVSTELTYDPVQEAHQLREQLGSHRRRLAFFLGAGTSMAVGMPGLEALTKTVSEIMPPEHRAGFDEVSKAAGVSANLEEILDKTRLCCELIGEDQNRTYCGLGGSAAKALERSITRAIYDEVSRPAPDGFEPHIRFAQWLREIERDFPPEIFTTNYDLLLELGLESDPSVPYFDGFVGSVNPFFVPESVEADGSRETMSNYPPRAWVRLWKVHGSIGWRIGKQLTAGGRRIYRTAATLQEADEELLIYPARQKYEESRKLPYMAYVDRLRRFASLGESLLVILGYSFRDEHLNEIVFQGLRSNVRFNVLAFVRGNETYNRVRNLVSPFRRLALYGPKAALIGGEERSWQWKADMSKDLPSTYWDQANEQFLLGEFKSFVRFLAKSVALMQESPLMKEQNMELKG